MACQGKCSKCKIRYVWEREFPLSKSICPLCKNPLQRTSYLSKFRVKATKTILISKRMRKYGKTSVNPGTPEDLNRCIVAVNSQWSVRRGLRWKAYQCSRKRGHGIDGLFCKQHSKADPKDLHIPECVVVMWPIITESR